MDRTLHFERDGVRLEPLAATHLPDLARSCNDEALWEFTYQTNPFRSEATGRPWLDETLADRSCVAFAIVDAASARTIGSTRFFDIQPEHRKLEIGFTFIARAFWRTHVNRTCKAMLLEYAFESWRATRVQFKAGKTNLRSQNALAALGATYEGTLRNFRIRPGEGTANHVSFFSILDDEWPSVKAGLAGRAERAIRAQR